MSNDKEIPDREDVHNKVIDLMYSTHILNNSHRGDVAEALVMMALGDEWNFVGLGWHPWDLQYGSGPDRIRIQVKNIALQQIWGETKSPTLVFGWKSNPPSYFERDNPGVEIEDEGYFCDLFVFCLHLVSDEDNADQVDPQQWSFLVIPTEDLRSKRKSMVLSKALDKWTPIKWPELAEKVEVVANRL
ncbi:hypothetical protein LX73_0735 [Fodinibius salinus]|uniref:Uncharacterized protein n=1 Tax=Fodinibius salinus TaxID=860790 RepID=A0A5D3YSA2_9BACT|nr:hypothetical protein [Fodinibius salinus]TYP95431.1 hypothetical protein LX73_0735 [Fodinibius salinus]